VTSPADGLLHTDHGRLNKARQTFAAAAAATSAAAVTTDGGDAE